MKARWTTRHIDVIEQDNQELTVAYTEETALRAALSAFDENKTFNYDWETFKGRFEFLLRFCGGLTSVLPGTSQVESDFYIVKGEKDDLRQAPTDLLLEGILHAKNLDMLDIL